MTGLLTERYDDRIAGVLSCYDRVVVTAVPVSSKTAISAGTCRPKSMSITRETEGSNPSPSSSESPATSKPLHSTPHGIPASIRSTTRMSVSSISACPRTSKATTPISCTYCGHRLNKSRGPALAPSGSPVTRR
jgi:DNA-directed RNA polymerase subunit RPC12/RpoP